MYGLGVRILGKATSGDRLWIEIRFSVQFHDPGRNTIRVLLGFLGMFQKFLFCESGVDSLGRVVVSFVPRHAHQFGSQIIFSVSMASPGFAVYSSVTAPASMCFRARSRNPSTS